MEILESDVKQTLQKLVFSKRILVQSVKSNKLNETMINKMCSKQNNIQNTNPKEIRGYYARSICVLPTFVFASLSIYIFHLMLWLFDHHAVTYLQTYNSENTRNGLIRTQTYLWHDSGCKIYTLFRISQKLQLFPPPPPSLSFCIHVSQHKVCSHWVLDLLIRYSSKLN